MDEKNVDHILDEISRITFKHEIAIVEHIDSLAELLKDNNTDKAIKMLFDTYNKTLDDAYTDKEGHNQRSYIEAIAGGPFEAVPWALYNAVGAIYPYLEREQKDKALRQILSILDKRNYTEVNGERGSGHTTGIREPLLLSDIGIVRPIYWPGLDEGRYLINKYNNFFDFQKDLIDKNGIFRHKSVAHDFKGIGVNSDFVIAYALLRSDFCDFGEQYVKQANSSFLDRALHGIVALRFSRAETQEDIEKGSKRLKELLPKPLHNRIEPAREKADWADYRKY